MGPKEGSDLVAQQVRAGLANRSPASWQNTYPALRILSVGPLYQPPPQGRIKPHGVYLPRVQAS